MNRPAHSCELAVRPCREPGLIADLKTEDGEEMALIEIAPTTAMEDILRAYPSAKVGLFQRYHIVGCES